MSAARHILLALAVLLLIPRAPAEENVQYVASRHVLLTFASTGAAPVTGVELWVSGDDGQTWRKEPAKRISDDTVGYTTPDDGSYAFHLTLSNKVGASGKPPASGRKPHLRVVVDTSEPILQLHGIAPDHSGGDGRIALRATLVDENLGPMGLRIFCRPCGVETWSDCGTASGQDGLILWQPPTSVAGPFDIRVVATDLAGNRATGELHGIPTRVAASIAPVQPVSVAPAAPVVLVADPAPESAPPLSRPESIEHLRQLGLRFMRQRKYSLAAARFEDAVRQSPNDAELLVDLGTAQYWSKNYDEAENRYDAALKAAPDHPGAIEGLALVAATERRYPQAREHLLHLLRLSPDSDAAWLRYGDIEHKLGNAKKAHEAWRKVLELRNSDDSAREKARKRLSYFRPPRRTKP